MSQNRLSDLASEILTKTVLEAYSKSKSNSVYRWISHKNVHTFGVLHAFRRIVTNGGLSVNDELFDKIEAACLLHDLGRFYQHNGERVFSGSEFKYGIYGAALVAKCKIFPDSVVLAVKYHDVKNASDIFSDSVFQGLSEEMARESVFILHAVRDADKFENMEYAFTEAGKEHFFTLGENRTTEYTGFSPDTLLEFSEGKGTLSRDSIRTVSDKKLSIASWFLDFNFPESVNAFDSGFFEKVRTSIMESVVSDTERLLVEKGLNMSVLMCGMGLRS